MSNINETNNSTALSYNIGDTVYFIAEDNRAHHELDDNAIMSGTSIDNKIIKLVKLTIHGIHVLKYKICVTFDELSYLNTAFSIDINNENLFFDKEKAYSEFLKKCDSVISVI